MMQTCGPIANTTREIELAQHMETELSIYSFDALNQAILNFRQ